MKITKIGEFGLIDRIARQIRTDKSVIRGIGDDTAVLKWTKGKHLLVTTDMLIEDRHFRQKAPPEKIGWKALCCGISDIAAMGGVPKWAVISCGLPGNLSVNYINGIYAGIKKAAKMFGVNIVGGDTNASDKIILDVTVLGEAKKKDLTLRSGAKIGDYIFVTGALGGSIYGKHLDFIPRLKESQMLVKNFKINSMIDLSDGLSSDLGHILKQSEVGAIVYEDLIPRTKKRLLRHADFVGNPRNDVIASPANAKVYLKEKRGEAISIKNALSDGEDFELLFTMNKKEAYRLLDTRGKLFDCPVTRVGTVTDKKFGVKIVDIFGWKKDLPPRGFKHF